LRILRIIAQKLDLKPDEKVKIYAEGKKKIITEL